MKNALKVIWIHQKNGCQRPLKQRQNLYLLHVSGLNFQKNVTKLMPQKKSGDPGLWDNIHAKRKRIEEGSGEKMRKPGAKGAPTAKALKNSKPKPKKK